MMCCTFITAAYIFGDREAIASLASSPNHLTAKSKHAK